jgi:ATP-binding cassette, subfamily B, bacterial PglK
MLSTFHKIWSLLSLEEKKQSYVIFVMILLMALLEMVGVASIVPFISVMTDPEAIETNIYLRNFYHLFAFENTVEFLFWLGVLVFVTLLISISFKAFTTFTLLRFTQMSNYSLSSSMVGGYLRQPYEWFLNRHSAEIGQTVLSEVTQVINGALIPMLQLIAQGAVVLSILFLLVVFDPFLAIVTAVGLGGAYIGIYLIMRRYLFRLGAKRLEANRAKYRVIQETFGGVKDVKMSGLEALMLKSFKRPAKRHAQISASSSVASQLPRYALELVVFGGLLILSLYLMTKEEGASKTLTVIALYAFAGYRLMPAMQQVFANLTTLRVADSVLDKLYQDMSDFPSKNTQRNKLKPLQLKHCLTLKDVSYSYAGANRAAIREININILACTKIGVVGVTGSGKTTTIDVILGLLRPQKGALLIDGQIIDDDKIGAWQQAVGYVPQHIFLVDDTIKANIAFGIQAGQIDDAAVETAARNANLHEFVCGTKNGYDTLVGERGVKLSGGQRQRIGIARALYRNPAVLVFDESTSALDIATERAVMDALNNFNDRKTIILIAHRFSTVRSCDQIFLLDDGRVAESGTYDELMGSSDLFRSMA